ncbi:MAG: hypothetical protein EXR60_07140 [Dehalococcoidia bacterium]|nr:hypothetical protein [Dehalococcoidia bacterium]
MADRLKAADVIVGCAPGQGQLSVADLEALQLFRSDLVTGVDWYVALLQAIALWSSRREVVDGKEYVYLIAEEAFDWLALASRLLLAEDGHIPQEERDALLGRGEPPRALPEADFKRLIGPAKFRAYLNYFYGIVVEGALQRAVEAEVRKERRSRVIASNRGVPREAFSRIYDREQDELAGLFHRARGRAREAVQRRPPSPTERKEFLYWLFKYRVAHGEQARVASDTRKGLQRLARSGWRGPIAPADAPPGPPLPP